MHSLRLAVLATLTLGTGASAQGIDDILQAAGPATERLIVCAATLDVVAQMATARDGNAALIAQVRESAGVLAFGAGLTRVGAYGETDDVAFPAALDQAIALADLLLAIEADTPDTFLQDFSIEARYADCMAEAETMRQAMAEGMAGQE